MPYATARDGVKLYFEETGQGAPVVFVHEFAGDHRSWEPQVRCIGRYFRAVTYSARGYPPSEVPEDRARYSQSHARDDIIAVMDHLGIERAHVVGLSMGAFATLHLGLAAQHRALSLTIAGCGYGAPPGQREQFRRDCGAVAERFDREDMAAVAKDYTAATPRLAYLAKDPRGYAEFVRHMSEHSSRGSANTLRGVQMERPSLYELTEPMKKIAVPTLIIAGDDDEPSLEASLFLKRSIPGSGLLTLPRTGHTMNLEEPEAFNRALLDFFLAVEAGRWFLGGAR
jgi:pimeloyl-ACP methyl ester carboxylesterase